MDLLNEMNELNDSIHMSYKRFIYPIPSCDITNFYYKFK